MKFTLFALLLILLQPCFSQNHDYLAHAVEGFSKKKTSYITLHDGSEITGTIKKLDRKKGLFEKIILNTDDGKQKIDAEDIKFMYLPQSGWGKLAKSMNVMYDAQRWDGDNQINADYLRDGYAYFETSEVQIKKKKTQVLLMQLLNPAFSNKLKVYHDPWASESGGLGIGGIKVTGGRDKSYYFKKGDAIAYKLKKKHYDDQAPTIYEDCPEYFDSIKSELKWSKFEEQIYNYSQNCK